MRACVLFDTQARVAAGLLLSVLCAPTLQDPAERLGQRKGVGEIKRHPFFGSVHWALIANSAPPFVLAGPDTPGWLASMQAAPDAGSRDDKMATWTWMVGVCMLRVRPPPHPRRSSCAWGGVLLAVVFAQRCHTQEAFFLWVGRAYRKD